ncbi:SGNH/GDSL hydrolase family protein [Nocardioides sp. SOB77]|uniref:SGNH/GDSL hydrolase family protein n=1 Tax=Nocardioides oceani TaxID=3058369 RepID=A0ABT8FFF5_9ACTN|nr:SGNH/GDSL hydrolase family protein [Nocardioides oceani]MDN4173339.1 SGNH/GDSL hydrolase family protein [Nocardioides oceani]
MHAALRLGAAGLATTLTLTAAACTAGSEDEVLRYVALGDSFTAAPYVPQTNEADPCLRSTGNYPSVLARALDGGDHQVRLTDVSCSGARTSDLTGSQQVRGDAVPPQLDALDEDTDLVTLSIGGNDQALFSTMVYGCIELAQADPTGAPCTERAGTLGGGAALEDLVERIRGNLDGIYAEIADRAPDARVISVGYPDIFPPRGTPACQERLPLALGDFDLTHDLLAALDEAMRDAAADAGVDFLDVRALSEGHDICSADPWVNGQHTDKDAALEFHPFASYEQAVADALLEML